MLNHDAVVLDDPVLIDEALVEIQLALEDKLTWLNTAYGKAEKRKVVNNNVTEIFPAIHSGRNTKEDYIKLFPDSNLGNFSFFDITDGYGVDLARSKRAKAEFGFGLIFWFDFRKIYANNWENKSIGNVVELVLDALKFSTFRRSTIDFEQIFEQADNIYSGYTNFDIEHKFHYKPFGGFRINGAISFNTRCLTKQKVPQCGIESKGEFKDTTHAINSGGLSDGEYYCLSKGNSFGLPQGVIVQVNPGTSYANDSAATTGGVKNDECFAVSSSNVWGLPEGTIKLIAVNTNVFHEDKAAGRYGVPINAQYAMAVHNSFGLVKGVIKKRLS